MYQHFDHSLTINGETTTDLTYSNACHLYCQAVTANPDDDVKMSDKVGIVHWHEPGDNE